MKHLLTLSLALASTAALAQTTPPSSPTPADSVPATPLSFYGFADGYYGYDFNHGAGQQRPGFLYSHSRQNEFTVNNAVLGLRYQDEQVRGALGLHAGTYVAANYAAEAPAIRPLYEAYAGFRPFAKAWLDAGIFGSHIGFESALSKDNWTLTRSLMAENSPYYEAGLRLTYEASAKLTLTGLVLNGWQNIGENNQAKALGTQIQWKPTARLLLNSSTFYGNEQPQDSLRRRRYFHNFYASYAATRRLSLALVFDLGLQQASRPAGDAGPKYDRWHSGAAFVRYRLSDKWATTLRGEYYRSERGVIISLVAPVAGSPDVLIRGGSVNVDYAPTAKVLARVEGRVLHAREPIFFDADGTSRNVYGNLTSSIAISF
jgi:hypothetical protein